MNTKEPFDLAKMAITLLLVCLVVGATTGFFYMLYDNTDKRIDDMEKATESASMDRIYDLVQQYESNKGDFDAYPLVTNVVSALTEFQESDLLYVAVDISQGQVHHVGADDVYAFTYTGTNLTTVVPNAALTFTTVQSDIPVTDASKLLLPYSNCRCEIYLYRYDTSTGQVVDGLTNTGGMTGIYVVVHPVSLGGS